MLELEATVSDDTQFLALVSKLIGGAAEANGFSRLVVAHIDHWFGPRWLGFCGKLLGAAGVRSRRLTGLLTPPPFHPHRVLSVRGYDRAASGTFEMWGNISWLHGRRSSQANIDRTFLSRRAYAWYSGDTATADKGVVMVYLINGEWNAAWYVGFDKHPTWHLSVTRAIAPYRVHKLLEWGLPAAKSEPGATPDPLHLIGPDGS